MNVTIITVEAKSEVQTFKWNILLLVQELGEEVWLDNRQRTQGMCGSTVLTGASQLKNFRPVSNLSFLSKLLERVVQVRLQVLLDDNDMLPASQSAYRQYHSTETYNDMLLAADSGQVSALCLLDLTAAFDTVDHDLLMLRLERQFGLRGVLQRFSLYLSDRSFRVVLDNDSSSVVHLFCSVPQGSVLGPCLFIMYMADLADFVGERQVNFH